MDSYIYSWWDLVVDLNNMKVKLSETVDILGDYNLQKNILKSIVKKTVIQRSQIRVILNICFIY